MDTEFKLKLPASKHFEAKVSFMSHHVVIEQLRSRLSPQQMDMFNKSCMSHLIKLPKLQYCGALVHSLLLREVVNGTSIDDTSMRFLVGGEILEFSRLDFALILGLSMSRGIGLDDIVPGEHRLKNLYFSGVQKINLPAMMEAIENCGDDEDKVKLALVCLLEYFLLGKDKKNVTIDDRHLDLVDDLKEFNKFPWGRESYERTIVSLRKAVTRRATKKKVKKSKKSFEKPKKKDVKYTLLGCPYIFQVWAYETIRQVGDNFAIRTGVTECPRILQWHCKITPTYGQLNDLVFGLKKVDVSPIILSMWELKQLSYLKVDVVDENADTSAKANKDLKDEKNLIREQEMEIASLRSANQALQTKLEVLNQQPSTHDFHQLILLCTSLRSANRALQAKLKEDEMLVPPLEYVDGQQLMLEYVDGQQPMEVAQPKIVSTVKRQPVKDTLSTRFTWKIENFSRLNTVANKHYSDVFLVGSYKWQVSIFPKGNNEDYLSLYLDTADSANLPYAEFSLAVVNQIDNMYTVRKDTQHQFTAKEHDWGFDKFMPLSELNDPDRGYIVNDTCIVEAEVSICRLVKKQKVTVPVVMVYSSNDSEKSTALSGKSTEAESQSSVLSGK